MVLLLVKKNFKGPQLKLLSNIVFPEKFTPPQKNKKIAKSCCSKTSVFQFELLTPFVTSEYWTKPAARRGARSASGAPRSCHGDWPASSLVITDCGEMRGVKVESETLSPLSAAAWPLISDSHYNKHYRTQTAACSPQPPAKCWFWKNLLCFFQHYYNHFVWLP